MLDTAKIRAQREKKGLTQAEAAQRSGLNSRQRWNEIESGRAGNVTLDVLGRIAAALDVEPRELLKDTRQKGRDRGRSE
jgi:transcriptional regulator with XRE-family HTH domain